VNRGPGLLLLLMLPLAGCHLGPFYDIYQTRIGPDLHRLSRLAESQVKAGETGVAELVALLGPPTRIERKRDDLALIYSSEIQDRHWYGIGIGMLGFNLHLFDHDTIVEPQQRLLFLVEDDVVIGVGNTVSGLEE